MFICAMNAEQSARVFAEPMNIEKVPFDLANMCSIF